MTPTDTAQVLTQALPYIQRLADQIVVVKFGGNAMTDDALARTFAADIVLMQSVGIKPIVVHGGGPQIGELLARVGKESTFVDGLRVTDADTLDIARMVLVGKVNRDIVSAINRHGPLAVGVSGEDAGLIRASDAIPRSASSAMSPEVNPSIIHRLLGESLIPVVSTIGADETGQAYNINADTVAGVLAAAVGASKLIMLTDVDGLRKDPADASSLISSIDPDGLRGLVGNRDGVRRHDPQGGASLYAVDHGVTNATMANGTTPHVLLLELFTDAGIGTLIGAEL